MKLKRLNAIQRGNVQRRLHAEKKLLRMQLITYHCKYNISVFTIYTFWLDLVPNLKFFSYKYETIQKHSDIIMFYQYNTIKIEMFTRHWDFKLNMLVSKFTAFTGNRLLWLQLKGIEVVMFL